MAIQETIAGVDVTATQNVPSFRLGQEAVDSTGTVYKYVYASAARTQYVPYFVNHEHKLHSLAVTSQAAGLNAAYVAVPQIAFDTPTTGYTNRYGWAAVKGPFIASTVSAINNPNLVGLWITGGLAQKGAAGLVNTPSFIGGLVAQSSIAITAQGGMFASDVMRPTFI